MSLEGNNTIQNSAENITYANEKLSADKNLDNLSNNTQTNEKLALKEYQCKIEDHGNNLDKLSTLCGENEKFTEGFVSILDKYLQTDTQTT